jgi:hypothetical protein
MVQRYARRGMSKNEYRDVARPLVAAACIACAGLAIGDMLRQLRTHS